MTTGRFMTTTFDVVRTCSSGYTRNLTAKMVGFSCQQKSNELLSEAFSHLAFLSALPAHRALVKWALHIASLVPLIISSMVSDAKLALQKPIHWKVQLVHIHASQRGLANSQTSMLSTLNAKIRNSWWLYTGLEKLEKCRLKTWFVTLLMKTLFWQYSLTWLR